MALTKVLVKGQALTAQEHDDNVDDLDQRPNGQVYPKESNTGIKIDNAAPDWGWHDLVGNIHYDETTPATLPVYTTYVGNIKARQFDVNDEGFLELHMPHDYAKGTDIYIHVHWSHASLTVTSGGPTYAVEGTYAKGHNQAAFGAPVSVTLTEPASTTRYQHMVTESQFSNTGGTGGLLDTALLEPDGMFLLRVTMTANDMNGGVMPFVHLVDVHYQSTQLPTKNKSPDFYGAI